MDAWMDDEWGMDGSADGLMNGWMNDWMDERMDGIDLIDGMGEKIQSSSWILKNK